MSRGTRRECVGEEVRSCLIHHFLHQLRFLYVRFVSVAVTIVIVASITSASYTYERRASVTDDGNHRKIFSVSERKKYYRIWIRARWRTMFKRSIIVSKLPPFFQIDVEYVEAIYLSLDTAMQIFLPVLLSPRKLEVED